MMTSEAGPSEAVLHGGSRRTKNLQGEIKKRREGRKEREKRRGERKEKGEKERKGEGSKRERCIRPMGVKHPLRTVKRYKTHETRGLKKFLKSRKRGRRDRNGQTKHGDREQIEM